MTNTQPLPDYSRFYRHTGSLHRDLVSALKDSIPSPTPRRFLHIVNHIHMDESKQLARAQKVSWESMRRSRAYTMQFQTDLVIDLLATGFAEDRPAIPQGFIPVAELTRKASDLFDFNTPRPLPLLFDILERGRDHHLATRAEGVRDYIILTNADIAVLPHFYSYADWLIGMGHDAVIINRREIDDFSEDVANLAAMQAEMGTDHPGLDCFIFPADWMEDFVRSDSIIGTGMVMRSLLFNLIAKADNPVAILDAHATFHIGIDPDTGIQHYRDYEAHNMAECLKVIAALETRPGVRDRLQRFVHDTHEHSWLPDGILGVRRPQPGPVSRLFRPVKQRLKRMLSS